MELDDLLAKLKFLKAVPFIKSVGVEEVVEMAYKSVKFLHETVKAHTLTIAKLEGRIEELEYDLERYSRRVNSMNVRLATVEEKAFGDEE